MKKFEDELYDAMCEAIPGTTVRSFSQALGMSDGYWSSLRSQSLSVSKSALVHLSEYLDVRELLLQKESCQSRKLKQVQAMIAREMVRRFAQDVSEIGSISAELHIAVAEAVDDSSFGFNAMPFVMSTLR
jgi:predicted trehalose synthase